MRNFTRLVRFAWPYRWRFGLSLLCASLIALLWFTELGAVYPLLKVLFNSENCQTWLVEKIEADQTEVLAVRSRLGELQAVPTLVVGGDRRSPALRAHARQVAEARDAAEEVLQAAERKVASPFALEDPAAADAPDPAELARLRRDAAVTKARDQEMRRAVEWVNRADPVAPSARRAELERELADKDRWLARYRWLQPRVERYLPRDSFQTLVMLIGLVMLGVTIKGVFLFLQELLVAHVVQLTLFDVRNVFFRRTMRLDLASFNDQGTADLMARFTNDVDSLSQGFSTLLSKVVREPLRVFTCLGGALWLNWRLTLLTMVLVPVSAMTTVRVGRIMKRAVRRSLESMSNIYKILQETFQGIRIVKAFTNERQERRRFFLETKSLYKKAVRVARIDAMSDPVLEMLALSTVSIALLAGAYLVLNRTMFLRVGPLEIQLASQVPMIEDLLTLYAMLAGMSDPIRKLANVHSKIQRAAAAADRICGLMDREPQVADRPKAPRLAGHGKSIEFDQVGFSYNGREPVLRGVDLAVAHGETIALVGPNGCGKSTLMALLPRFYDVQAGAIRVDGHDVRDVRLRSLRRMIGLVSQETVLFDSTVADNIAYGTPSASRAEIEAAAKRSYADSFIRGLPQGYDTPLGERGMSLSGGQRQRIALARAMLRDPAILILDEATSAVDIQDEALIRKAIEEFSRGRTTFLITHSLSALQLADRIVLMDSGRIDAVGTDAELRRSSSLYRRLHEIEFRREVA